MTIPVKAVVGGLAGAVLMVAMSRAAPLVLGDEAMSQVRTSYEVAEPGPWMAEPQSATLRLGASAFTASVSPAFRPTARPRTSEPAAQVAALAIAPLRETPAPKARPGAVGRTGDATRLLSDSEADQVTAAGFLFPVAAAIGTRTIIARPTIIFSPVARTKTMMRDVVVVPRPPASMIFNIGRL